MTPAAHQTLTEAVALIRAASNADSFDVEAVKDALRQLGAQFAEECGPGGLPRHVMSLARVTVKCTFDNGEQLLVRWAANARAAIETAEVLHDTAGEEE